MHEDLLKAEDGLRIGTLSRMEFSSLIPPLIIAKMRFQMVVKVLQGLNDFATAHPEGREPMIDHQVVWVDA